MLFFKEQQSWSFLFLWPCPSEDEQFKCLFFIVSLSVCLFLGCSHNETRRKWDSVNARGYIKTLSQWPKTHLFGDKLLIQTWSSGFCGALHEEIPDAFTHGELRGRWHSPSLTMLALRLEQSRRGLGEVESLQKEAAPAWQGRQAGRPSSHEQGINIKEKISQWEGRSQQSGCQDVGGKAHPPVVSRTLSADLLGNGCSSQSSRGGPQRKENLSKAKSIGFDFREIPSHVGHGAAARKSEPLAKCSTQLSSPVAKTLASPKEKANTTISPGKHIFSPNGDQRVGRILDVELVPKPLPPSTDDHEDNMPAGNFYTSRGFWRKLEGDRLLWEKGRSSAGEALPPPKPQRTFQYRATNNNAGRTVQWDSSSPRNNRYSARTRRAAHPPAFPPPPCPVSRNDGLSRHNKSR